MSEPLAYTTAELMKRLPVGRHTARRLMAELGVQVSPRRRLLPAVRLERWLAEGGDAMTNHPTRDEEDGRPEPEPETAV